MLKDTLQRIDIEWIYFLRNVQYVALMKKKCKDVCSIFNLINYKFNPKYYSLTLGLSFFPKIPKNVKTMENVTFFREILQN